MRHEGRLDKLEKRSLGPGEMRVVYGDDGEGGTGKPDPQALADARAKMGPADVLFVVTYGDWPPGGSDGTS